MDNALRGVVLTKFRSIAAFARAVNWDRKKASRIVNHVQYPTVGDMEIMIDVLDIPDADSFVRIILPWFSTMWK